MLMSSMSTASKSCSGSMLLLLLPSAQRPADAVSHELVNVGCADCVSLDDDHVQCVPEVGRWTIPLTVRCHNGATQWQWQQHGTLWLATVWLPHAPTTAATGHAHQRLVRSYLSRSMQACRRELALAQLSLLKANLTAIFVVSLQLAVPTLYTRHWAGLDCVLCLTSHLMPWFLLSVTPAL